MQLTTTVICPYCGHENGYYAGIEQGRVIKYCDSDSGGCGGMFIVEHKAHVTATTRRIEGEEKHAAERECRGCPLHHAEPKLTEDEEIFVRWAVELSFKYLAREQCGDLWIYENKPIKGTIWSHNEDTNAAKVNTDKYTFSFVKWEDAEPYYLPDLLGGKP